MSRAKSIGTNAETITVMVAQRNGFPFARRTTLSGAYDKGDCHLGDGTDTVIEVKGGKQCQSLSPAKMTKWIAETRQEIQNSKSTLGFLVTQRAGFGKVNAERWFAHVPKEICDILSVANETDYVTMELGEVLKLVRGYLDAKE